MTCSSSEPPESIRAERPALWRKVENEQAVPYMRTIGGEARRT